MGDGRKFRDPNYMIFSERNCNYPQPKYAKWWLTQFRRWGFVEGAPDYEGVSKQVMRPDIYEEAMKEIGYSHGGLSDESETLFDGLTFDPKGDLEAYAKSFSGQQCEGLGRWILLNNSQMETGAMRKLTGGQAERLMATRWKPGSVAVARAWSVT